MITPAVSPGCPCTVASTPAPPSSLPTTAPPTAPTAPTAFDSASGDDGAIGKVQALVSALGQSPIQQPVGTPLQAVFDYRSPEGALSSLKSITDIRNQLLARRASELQAGAARNNGQVDAAALAALNLETRATRRMEDTLARSTELLPHMNGRDAVRLYELTADASKSNGQINTAAVDSLLLEIEARAGLLSPHVAGGVASIQQIAGLRNQVLAMRSYELTVDAVKNNGEVNTAALAALNIEVASTQHLAMLGHNLKEAGRTGATPGDASALQALSADAPRNGGNVDTAALAKITTTMAVRSGAMGEQDAALLVQLASEIAIRERELATASYELVANAARANGQVDMAALAAVNLKTDELTSRHALYQQRWNASYRPPAVAPVSAATA